VSGDIEPSKPKRETASSDAQGGIGTDDCIGVDIYNTALTWDKACPLTTGFTTTGTCPKVMHSTVYNGSNITSPFNKVNPQPGDVCHTLLNDNRNYLIQSVCYSVENHPADSRVDIDESGKVQTLTSRMGTGGGNVPMVLALDRATFNQGKNAQFDFEVSDKGVNSPLVAKGPSAVCYKKTRYIVRRLTPLECERLQGYPDGRTDIGEWVDSNGKTRQTSDAARYKALGNSIALPPWKWVLKRLCACYERDATTASLFDGIGGFPYLWEQLNGKGSCLWASEIEDFPIAVTKVRIG
jgi:site-specific DNA-cytosine methylase